MFRLQVLELPRRDAELGRRAVRMVEISPSVGRKPRISVDVVKGV